MILDTKEVEAKMSECNVPGMSISIIDKNQVSSEYVLGFTEANKPDKITLQTMFHSCSMSKFVTSLAILRLVSSGSLSLDMDINKQLKSWQMPVNDFNSNNPVTLRHLLCHQGGLIDPEGSFGNLNHNEDYPSILEILSGQSIYHQGDIEAKFVPGSNFAYSDAGFCILEQLIVDKVGLPFPDIISESVLKPLGMNLSHYDNFTNGSILTRGHNDKGISLPINEPVYPYKAAAGLWTTSMDFSKLIFEVFDALEGNSKLGIKKRYIQEMLSPQGGFGWSGLGVFLDNKDDILQFASWGWGVGFQCMLVAFPKQYQGAVVMINCEPGKTQEE